MKTTFVIAITAGLLFAGANAEEATRHAASNKPSAMAKVKQAAASTAAKVEGAVKAGARTTGHALKRLKPHRRPNAAKARAGRPSTMT